MNGKLFTGRIEYSYFKTVPDKDFVIHSGLCDMVFVGPREWSLKSPKTSDKSLGLPRSYKHHVTQPLVIQSLNVGFRRKNIDKHL